MFNYKFTLDSSRLSTDVGLSETAVTQFGSLNLLTPTLVVHYTKVILWNYSADSSFLWLSLFLVCKLFISLNT